MSTVDDRCPECGGRIKGFTANVIRQCPHEWHFTPAGLSEREYRALYRLVRAGEGYEGDYERLAVSITDDEQRDNDGLAAAGLADPYAEWRDHGEPVG